MMSHLEITSDGSNMYLMITFFWVQKGHFSPLKKHVRIGLVSFLNLEQAAYKLLEPVHKLEG